MMELKKKYYMIASFIFIFYCSSIERVEWLIVFCFNSGGDFNFKYFANVNYIFYKILFYFVLIFSFHYKGKRISLDIKSSDKKELLMVADASSFTEQIKQTPFIQSEKCFPHLLHKLTYNINFKSQPYGQDFLITGHPMHQ